MSGRPVAPPLDAINTQRLVTDPEASAWVSANAGSGKTFVLTRRVIRLLLSGVAPETILCLTYTKAAAAEMRHRVSRILGEWTLMGDAELIGELTALLDAEPGEALVTRARQLFALALETPGGLKINTIHAFCEAVLQRFPLEAGVPVNFRVIEEADRNAMIREAREAVLAESLRDSGPSGDAARLLFSRLSDHQIECAISDALNLGRKLEPVLSDIAGARANLFSLLGIDGDASTQAIAAEALAGRMLSAGDCNRILELTPPGNGTRPQFEDRLAGIDHATVRYEDWRALFLTASHRAPRTGFPKKQIRTQDPGLAEAMTAEAERLEALDARYRAARIAEESLALLDILSAIIARYEAGKRARSWLDFDDLVLRTAALLANREHGAWVRYKLDAGIDHVLVDESQDTNPEQWRVFEALVEDYFAGESTGRPKTLFGVGDPKQSIYSFQGAEPHLFIDTGREMKRRAQQAGKIFHDREMRSSFRTLPGILEGVDRIASRPEVAGGLFPPAGGIRHESARTDTGGTITIWPVIETPDPPGQDEGWPLQPLENLASAPRQLAQRIARTIRHWVDNKTPLGPRGRAIRPEDVMILVRRRSREFGEIIRALKEERIDSPGADRLPVSAHIVVDDLLGLADVLLNPGDDLTLAAILRSPLFAFSEDDLFALAARRGELSLWQALGRSQAPVAKSAHDELHALRQRLDLDRPYEFYAHVLYAQSGLRRFHARLGAEVDEVIAEFLDLALEHEKTDQPSLTGFVAAMRRSDIVIKRDLVAKTSGVRVMTVHGAKGLEAPIVILADAASAPQSFNQCVFTGPPARPFLLYCASARRDCDASAQLRAAEKQKRDEEYWRNLYVAMTRAEDALIVAGCLGSATRDIDKAVAGRWHGVVKSALAPEAETIEDPASGLEVMRFPLGAPAPRPIAEAAAAPYPAPGPLALAPLTMRAPRHVITPSQIGVTRGHAHGLDPAIDRLLDAESARDKGIALHALLQHLTRVPPDIRPDVAEMAARTLLAERPDLSQGVAEEALAILSDPALAALFGPASRAEVSFALDGVRDGVPVRLTGRIDRLVSDRNGITVVDFKSDAIPPQDLDGVPEAYCVQLGLYAKVASRLFPGETVTAAILWTTPRRLMVLDPDMLAAASASIALV